MLWADLYIKRNPYPKDVPRRIWDEDIKGASDLATEVITLRLGLSSGSPLTVTQVAKSLKITRERVRIIEAKARAKIKKVLHRNNEIPLKRFR